MELNIFFFHARSTKEKMMSIFMWCKKAWFFFFFTGSMEYFRPWEKLVLGGLHRIWRRTLPMSGKVRPSFMSRININFNNLLPQVWYQAIIFWKLICTYNVYTYILYTIFFYSYDFCFNIFWCIFDDWKIIYNMLRKKVSIWFLK